MNTIRSKKLNSIKAKHEKNKEVKIYHIKRNYIKAVKKYKKEET